VLASTGTDPTVPLVAAFVLLLLGGAAVGLAQRKG
jgi:LPXTG-motif cell wall-anchored protein